MVVSSRFCGGLRGVRMRVQGAGVGVGVRRRCTRRYACVCSGACAGMSLCVHDAWVRAYLQMECVF